MDTPKNQTQPQKEKPQKPKYNMWQNSAYMISLAVREKEKKVLVTSFLLAVLAVSMNLTDLYITPVILGTIESKAPLGQLLTTILIFAGLSLILSAARTYVGKNSLYGKVTLRSTIIAKLNTKQMTTSYPNIDDKNFQEMFAKTEEATYSNWAAAEAIWNTLTSLFQNTLGFIIYLILLSTVNPLLFVVITFLAVIGYSINKPLGEYRFRHREEEGKLDLFFSAFFSHARNTKMAKDIRLFGFRSWLEEIYAKTMDAYTDFQRHAENWLMWGGIADLVIAFLRNGIAYAYLIYLVLNKDLSVSLFLLYFTAVGSFSAWITHIFGDLVTLHRQSLEISNIRECLEYPEPFRFDEGEELIPEIHKKYEIRFENVSFRYPGAENDTLTHINLTLRPGEKLAIVGLNGAGKTTLIKLLCGFLDPTEGRVLLNGVDIRKYNRRDYYKMFSAVFQDFTVIAATIAVNVAQTEDSIDMTLVRKCVAQAGLTEKIESLPEQYETKLNRQVYDDAIMLSGGETQRLMLARALYKNAPFVILDEPTAALDPIAEADMYNKYHETTLGRSSVYISHRLASTRFCDRIILIENGQIAEEGTHDTLLALGGKYTEMFEAQSKYYKPAGAHAEP